MSRSRCLIAPRSHGDRHADRAVFLRDAFAYVALLCLLVGGACKSAKTTPISATGGKSGVGGAGSGGAGGTYVDAGVSPDGLPSSCGEVDGPTATSPDAGEGTCTSAQVCTPGLLCGGSNCDVPWICFSHDSAREHHPCPTTSAEYCGCDGVTFTALDTCPDRPYEYWGACSDGVNCDSGDLRCTLAEPTCPAGMVPSVVKGSYGPCVAASRCRCEFQWECPLRNLYACNTTSHRCGPKPAADAGEDGPTSDAAIRSSGVDITKRLDALTPGERGTLCDFRASFYGGYGMALQCGAGLVLLNEYQSQADCLAAWPVTCAVNVAQFEQCSNDRTCAHPSPPSCDALVPCKNTQ